MRDGRLASLPTQIFPGRNRAWRRIIIDCQSAKPSGVERWRIQKQPPDGLRHPAAENACGSEQAIHRPWRQSSHLTSAENGMKFLDKFRRRPTLERPMRPTMSFMHGRSRSDYDSRFPDLEKTLPLPPFRAPICLRSITADDLINHPKARNMERGDQKTAR